MAITFSSPQFKTQQDIICGGDFKVSIPTEYNKQSVQNLIWKYKYPDSSEVKEIVRWEHTLGPEILETIDNDTMVIILDRRNPWRQYLGATIKGLQSQFEHQTTLPATVLCHTVEPSEIDNSRDEYSVDLHGILRSEFYHWDLFFVDSHKILTEKEGGQVEVAAVGPLDMHCRAKELLSPGPLVRAPHLGSDGTTTPEMPGPASPNMHFNERLQYMDSEAAFGGQTWDGAWSQA